MSGGGELRQMVVSVPGECCDHQNGQPTARYEIISVRERHGRFRKAVPLLPLPVAVALCLLNVLLPGVAHRVVYRWIEAGTTSFEPTRNGPMMIFYHRLARE
ncbi:hypothetical protein V5799_000424 [Amblyomma americanum]|uniref:Uncharacterized protein n=1 Tax=Amblyomma americanum TaxID=6943 RepID=A0AAQ4D334_AMBAM